MRIQWRSKVPDRFANFPPTQRVRRWNYEFDTINVWLLWKLEEWGVALGFFGHSLWYSRETAFGILI